MEKQLKLTVIGAGSTYTPEIIEGVLARQETLPIKTICFMDIDEKKMEITGGLTKRMLAAAGYTGSFCTTTSMEQAVDGADYVIAQIRVGGLAARIRDEKIPLKYDLIGQETTGIGGFMKAMRTIGPIMNLAREIEKRCPEAWFINFTNPSGLIAEAVLGHTKARLLGLCNCPINMLADIEKTMTQGSPYEYTYVGLNHLSWITSVIVGGKELIRPGAFTAGTGMRNIPDIKLDPELLRAVNAIPSSYLGYFYMRDEHLKKCQRAEKSRGEECVEVEKALLESYQNPNLSQKPEELAMRGGALYSTAAVSLIHSIENDTGDVQVVNTRNNGALPFMDDSDVVEVKAVINSAGAAPVPVGSFDNTHIVGLMRAVKAYEKLAVEAGLEGDADKALCALLTHPLIGDFEKAKPALKEMLEANRAYVGQFFGE